MAELKSCPFCGHTNIQVFVEYKDDGGYVYAMVCTKCMANGPWKDTEQQAIDAWNKRS